MERRVARRNEGGVNLDPATFPYDASNTPPHVWAALRDADKWGPEQHGEELAPFAAMVASVGPHNVLEIGFRRGGTLAVWHGISSGTVIGLDLPEEFTEKRSAELWEAYPRVWCLLADSHQASTLAEVKRRLMGEPVDFLFIDGDHSPEGVRQDFEIYAPLVRKGGIVGLHDIQPHPGSMGVHEFWRELSRNPNAQEFNIGAIWGGIGALVV